MADVVVPGVGEDDEVGGHLRPVLLEEAVQVPGANLLLALDDELDVELFAARREEPTAATWAMTPPLSSAVSRP
jgi:hypothetical protein